MADDFLLNFAAQIDVSRVNISSNVTSALAGISKSVGSGTIKKRVVVDFDIGKIGQVTSAANSLVADLQNTIGKAKIAPSIVLNTNELTNAAGKLALIPPLLTSIKTVMNAISKNPSMVPNAEQELGKLALIKNAVESVKKSASKVVKIQLAPELEPVRKFDSQIIGASTRAANLAKELAQVKADRSVAAERLNPLTSARDKTKQAFINASNVSKTNAADKPGIIKSAEEDLKSKDLLLEQALKAQNAAKPTAKAIDIAQNDLTSKKVETMRAKEAADAAKLAKDRLISGTTPSATGSALTAAMEQKNRAAELLFSKKQEDALKTPVAKKQLKPESENLTSAKRDLTILQGDLSAAETVRNAQLDILRKASDAAQKAYDKAASDYDKANPGRRDIKARNSSLKSVSDKKSEANRAFDEVKKGADIVSIRAEIEKSKLVVSSAESALQSRKNSILEASKLLTLDQAQANTWKEIKTQVEAVTKAEAAHNAVIAASTKAAEAKNKAWLDAAKNQEAAQTKVSTLEAASKGGGTAGASAAARVQEASKDKGNAEERLKLLQAKSIDEKLSLAKKAESQAKSVVNNLIKEQNAQENIRAIEVQRADNENKSDAEKVAGLGRITNAENQLNNPIEKRISLLAAQKVLQEATAKRKDLEKESVESGGLEMSKKNFRTAISSRNQQAGTVQVLDDRILKLQNAINAETAKGVDLERQQSAAAAKMTGNLSADVQLRKQVLAIVERTVQEEKNLQNRIGKSLSSAGIKPEFPDARQKATQRLNVTPEEMQNPTPELLTKLKEARPNIASQRSEELVGTLNKLSQSERARVVKQRLEDSDRLSAKAGVLRANIDPAATTSALRETGARTLLESNKNAVRSAAFGMSKTEPTKVNESSVLDTAELAETEQALRSINASIRRQKEDVKALTEQNRALNAIRKDNLFIEQTIEKVMRDEVKLRSRIQDALAKQGVVFNKQTGEAAPSTPSGLGPAIQVAPAGNSRELALRRLGVTEEDLTNPDRRAVRDRLVSAAKPISDQRQQELQIVSARANIEVATEKNIGRLSRLIEKQIELERRRAAFTGLAAPSNADIEAKIVGSNVRKSDSGPEVKTLASARQTLSSSDAAENVATRNKIVVATNAQNEEIRAQGVLEAENERRVAATNARNRQRLREEATEMRRRAAEIAAINKLIDQTTLALEKQARAVNNFSRRGGSDANGDPLKPIQIDQQRLREQARRQVLGADEGRDLIQIPSQRLAVIRTGSQQRMGEQNAGLRQFNDDLSAVSQGSKSGFEIIAKYGESAFDRIGAKTGLATQRLATYAFGAVGLYGLIAATRAAIVETALLEKEITNIEQIFGSGFNNTDNLADSFDAASSAAAKTKKQVLDLSEVTGQTAVSLAQSGKTLAAAGFSRGKVGFDETIRAVSFATLGPSFGNSQEVIDGLIATVNQFNRSLSETPYILGLVNEYSKAYAVESQDLFEAIKRGGGSFAAVGGNFEDYIKLVTVLREKTREAAPAIGTFLKSLSVRLNTPRAEAAMKKLGVDVDNISDPYERLIALATKYKEISKSQGSTQTLSAIVDVRSVGRLAALLEGLDDAQNKFKDLSAGATDSIVNDARKRLDDIGPAIDKIRASYFRFVEGIYNNPATKALLRIPVGLGSILSAVPEASIGPVKGADVLNPLAQGAITVGLVSVLRGSIRAYIAGQNSVRLNTESLNRLRAAIETMRPSGAGGQAIGVAGAIRAGGQGGGAPAGVAGAIGGAAATGAARGGGRNLIGRLSGGINPLYGLAAATLAPAIANTVLPMTGMSDANQNIASSAVQGGALGGLGASLLTANPYIIGGTAIATAGLSAYGALRESNAQEKELEKVREQSNRGLRFNAAEKVIASGELPRQFDLPSANKDTEDYLRAVAKVQEMQKKALQDQVLKEGQQYKVGTGTATTTGGIQDFLISGGTGDSASNKNKAERRESFKQAFGGDEEKIKEAEKGLAATAEFVKNTIISNFQRNARSIPESEDNVQTRTAAARKTAQDLAGKFTVEGVKFDEEKIFKSLLDQFTAVEEGVDGFTASITRFKFTFKSLAEISDAAERSLNVFSNALSSSIKSQTSLIGVLVSETQRLSTQLETTKGILSSPFKVGSIQQINTDPTDRNVAAASNAIEAITGQKAQRVNSPEIQSLKNTLDEVFIQFSQADKNVQNNLLINLEPESLKAIGGLQAKATQDEEAAAAKSGLPSSGTTFQSAEQVRESIEQAFGDLKKLGDGGKKLFDIIQQSGPQGKLPFSLEELRKALQDKNPAGFSSSKLLGVDEAGSAQIAQANALITLANNLYETQAKTIEARAAAEQESYKSQVELAKAVADNRSTIEGFQGALGLKTQRGAAQASLDIQTQALSQRQNIPNSNIIGDKTAVAELLQTNIETEMGSAVVNSSNVNTTNDKRSLSNDKTRSQSDNSPKTARSLKLPDNLSSDLEAQLIKTPERRRPLADRQSQLSNAAAVMDRVQLEMKDAETRVTSGDLSIQEPSTAKNLKDQADRKSRLDNADVVMRQVIDAQSRRPVSDAIRASDNTNLAAQVKIRSQENPSEVAPNAAPRVKPTTELAPTTANRLPELAPAIPTRDLSKAGSELSIIKQLQTSIEAQRALTADPLRPNNAPSNILELPSIKDLMSQLAALDSSFNISNNVFELSGSLMNLRSSIERGLINSLDVLESQFKLVGSQVDITSKKLSEQKATLESLTGKLYGGTPADNSMNKMTLSRAAGNANDIATAITRAIPNAKDQGVNTILTDQNVARLVENQIAGLSARDLGGVMDFSRLLGANELTQSGLSGEQLAAAIQAALASRPEFQALGINVKPTDIKSTVDQANKLIQDAQKIATEIQSARMQMDKSTSANLSIMNDQVSSLTAAISAIPKQINVVISGVKDISVTFDLTKVEESMRTVGDKVFDNVIGKLREVFRASNIPLPGI